MRKLASLFVATALALGAAGIVHAAADNLTPPPAGSEKSPHNRPMHNGMHEMFRGLNLSETQKQQIRAIMKENRQEMKRPPLEELRATHAIIAADTFDKTQAEAQAEKMAVHARERAIVMMETQNKVYNLLTPEQKTQYNANFEKHLTEKPGKHGNMAPPPAE